MSAKEVLAPRFLFLSQNKRISSTTASMSNLVRWSSRTSLALITAVATILTFSLFIYLPTSNLITRTPKAWTHVDHSSKCDSKPNLIISAINGAAVLDNTFIFMSSLEAALGSELRVAQQEHATCLPAEVEVKIITPPEFIQNLPESFQLLQHRYKNLEFLGELPMEDTNNVIFSRFIGLATLVKRIKSRYDRILFSDLDVIFQRNPFSMPMQNNVELLMFAEWRGYKIGQCGVHVNWFNGCMNTSKGPYVTREQYLSYEPLNRICAGSTYGTADAMSIYLDLMSTELLESNFECNDQALHIHNFYSGKLQQALTANLTRDATVKLMEEGESLVGTVGTTPYVRYNEWGEMLNSLGEVLAAVHQFKVHPRLTDMVHRKYAAHSKLHSTFPPETELVKDDAYSQANPNAMPRFVLSGIEPETCKRDDSLCSCRWDDCQFHGW